MKEVKELEKRDIQQSTISEEEKKIKIEKLIKIYRTSKGRE